MEIYHKINNNKTSVGFHVQLNSNDQILLKDKFENKNITVVKMGKLMNIHRQNVYLYLESTDLSLFRLLQIQQILDFEIVSKKDIDNFMNKFYLETINEVKNNG